MKLIGVATLGTDPETFVVMGDVIQCPSDIIPESKFVRYGWSRGGGMNRDGMALELNPFPSKSPIAVSENISYLLRDATKLLNQSGLKLSHMLGCSIDEIPEKAYLPEDVFKLGCDPDINAYTNCFNEVKVDATTFSERYAGGHIHMEVGYLLQEEACELVKLLDVKVGIPSVLMGDDIWSVKRRAVYGKAGSFRHNTTKGIIEYRTPDAGWLWQKGGFEKLAQGMMSAFEQFKSGIRVTDTYIQNIRRIIDACDKREACKIV